MHVAVAPLTYSTASHSSLTSPQTCLPHLLNTLGTDPSFARLFSFDGRFVDQVLHEERVIQIYLYIC